MGHGIVYCETCGDRLVEGDFQKGAAVTVNHKTYCAKCKTAVASGTPGGSSTLLKSVGHPPAGTAATKMVRPSSTRSIKTITDRATAKGTGTPLIIVGIVVVAAVGGLLVMTMGGSEPADKTSASAHLPPNPGARVSEDPLKKLAEEVRRLREDAGLPAARPEAILKEAERLKPLVAGTRFEGEVTEILQQASRAKAQATAGADFDAAMRRVGELRAADRTFEKRAEVLGQIAAAKEFATRLGAARREEAGKAEMEYNAAFIDHCAKAYEAAVETGKIWERDGRFDEAIDAIEKTFPPHLRESSYWPDLERRIAHYRDQKQRREAAPPPSPAPSKPVLEREDMPPAGKPFPLFDGTGLDRFVKVGKAAEAWKIDGKELAGECTTKEAPAQAIFDLLVTKADGFVHYEIEFEAKVEAGALLFLGRVNETGDRCSGIGAIQAANTGEWTRFKFVFSKDGFTGQRAENAPVKLQVQPGTDKGRPGFGMTAGSKVRVRNVRITPRD